MLWLYRWIRGVLTVEFDADIPEQCLNLCARNGVTVWNIKRVKGKIRCRMGIRDFRRMPAVARHGGVRVHILQKSGFPFLAARYRRRYGIPAGVLLFFAFLRFMSAFIWSVDVVGNREIATCDLIDACAQIGVFEGAYANGIDYKTASQQLLLRVPGLSWCSMNLEGCRLTVNISEAKKETEDHSPSNMKAATDGVITKIDVKTGNCLVKVGDTVAKGDLLVSGISEQTGSFLHSAGTVTAKTVREITVTVPEFKTERLETGKRLCKNLLSVFGIKIPLYLGKTGGEYRETFRMRQACLFGENLPLKVYQKTYSFVIVRKRRLDETEQRKEAERILGQKIRAAEMKGAEIEKREYERNNGTFFLKAIVKAEEEIAVQEKILFNAGN